MKRAVTYPNKTYRKKRRIPMTKVRMLSIPVVMIVVALMIPAITEAGSVKIWPDQLRPVYPNDPYEQGAYRAANGTFYASVTLPPGVTIVKISYFHVGETSPAQTSLGFFRAKMGKPREQLAGGSSTDSTAVIIPVNVSITGDPIIKAGYRYYIGVTSNYTDSLFLGVIITYN
jgi:hypothetical protein